MADTLANIIIPEKTWVNLYTESGITVGTQLVVQNVGRNEVFLLTAASAPVDGRLGTAYNVVRPYDSFQNATGDSGAFAWAETSTVVNVREA